MPQRQGSRLVNPLLGLLFGIFAAGLVALVVLLLILEQLGVTAETLRTAMAVAVLGLFGGIGAGAYSARAREYLLAGRRVPAFYNGLALTVTAFGGAGIAGIAGGMFLVGFDMLFLGLGMLAGLTAMVMLIAPFVRKLGTATVPAFLGERFDSGLVRLLAATIAVVPLMLVLVAELKIAVLALAWLLPLTPGSATLLVAAALVLTVAPGGARSQSWSSAAQGLAVLVAVLVPAAIAAVIETNLPFGQLSHGPLLRAVVRAEASQGLGVPIAAAMALDIPGEGLQPVAGRFLTTFGSVGPLAFVLATLSVLAGVAGSPALLARAATTPSVYDTRKSIGWAVVLAGVLLTTFSTIAAIERDILLGGGSLGTGAGLAQAVQRLVGLGIAAGDAGRPIVLAELRFERDGMLVALPVLMNMPDVVASLVAAGVLAAALAGAAASLCQLGIVVGEDVISAPESWRASDTARLTACRIVIAVAAALAGAVAVLASGDPLVLVLHALAVSGSTLFPVLVLGIWWKRTTAPGAAAGLAAGFLGALAVILMAEMAGGGGLPPALAPIVGVPLAIAATVVVSHLTPAPGRHMLEAVRDLRIPGGEPIHDREIRLARQRGQRNG